MSVSDKILKLKPGDKVKLKRIEKWEPEIINILDGNLRTFCEGISEMSSRAAKFSGKIVTVSFVDMGFNAPYFSIVEDERFIFTEEDIEQFPWEIETSTIDTNFLFNFLQK